MPQTILDLGKKVKAKYPGQYDDLADDEVGRRVKAKYPGDYDDFTDVPAVAPSLLSSRQAASASEFEANQPKSTPLSRARELVLQGSEMLGVAPASGNATPGPGLAVSGRTVTETAKNLARTGVEMVKAQATGRLPLMLAEGLISQGAAGPSEAIEGAMEGDYDKMAGGVGKTITGTLPLFYGGVKAGRGLATATKARFNRPMAPEKRVASMTTLMEHAVKNERIAPQDVASDALPRWKQAHQEFGLDPQSIPVSKRLPSSELIRGGTEAELGKVNSILKAEHDVAVAAGEATGPFIPEKYLTVAKAERSVDIAHRPIGQTVKMFADVDMPEVQQAIIRDLRTLAAEAGEPKLARAYSNEISKIEKAGARVAGLNSVKVLNNKAPNKMFSGSLSNQISFDANPLIAKYEAAASIRRHLYPALENIAEINGQPMKGFLIESGRREANAIMARDGVIQSWSKATGRQAPASLESYWHHVLRGHSESVPIAGSPFRRPAMVNALGRALTGVENPMVEFNRLLRNGVGTLEGFTPEAFTVSPVRQLAPGSPPSGIEVTTTPWEELGDRRRLLPAYREPIVTPPPLDASRVTGIPATFPSKSPAWFFNRLRESGGAAKTGGALVGEARGLTQMVDARLAEIRDLARSGVTETTGKALGRDPNANYGTATVRKGGGLNIPELQRLGVDPAEAAAAIERKAANPSASNVVYDRIRRAVSEAMQAERESRPGSGPEPLAVKAQRAFESKRRQSSEPPF